LLIEFRRHIKLISEASKLRLAFVFCNRLEELLGQMIRHSWNANDTLRS